MYDLKQAGKLYYDLVHSVLVGLGCVQCTDVDDCLFILREGDNWVKILVYVDDYAVTTNSPELYARLWTGVSAAFDITDYGQLGLFLGIKISRGSDYTITLDQSHYVDILMKRFDVPRATYRAPLSSGTYGKLSHCLPSENIGDDVPYKSAVGALFWLARATRLDIAYAVCQVARFVECHSMKHWHAVLRILAYLACTRGVAIRMSLPGKPNEMTLDACADSDWAGDAETRRSRSGWIVRIGGCFVAWRSTIQGGYAQSATEAEYIALNHAAREVFWWRKLFRTMNWSLGGPTPIEEDNRGCRELAEHSGNFNSTKHIELKFHSIRAWIRHGVFAVVPVAGLDNFADLLTKNCSAVILVMIALRLLRW